MSICGSTCSIIIIKNFIIIIIIIGFVICVTISGSCTSNNVVICTRTVYVGFWNLDGQACSLAVLFLLFGCKGSLDETCHGFQMVWIRLYLFVFLV